MNALFDIDSLLERMLGFGDAACLKKLNRSYSYFDLCNAVGKWHFDLQDIDITRGTVGLAADYSLDGIAALFALWKMRASVALIPSHAVGDGRYRDSGHLAYLLVVEEESEAILNELELPPRSPLLDELRASGNPGLVLFSSGSSGQPKAILHDLHRFISKFDTVGKALTTYAFLVFDHVAGQDTLLYTLSAGGCLVAGASRRPRIVAALVEEHRIEVLPASPSFLNLLLVSGALQEFDMSSLAIITYGSEPMSEAVLGRLVDSFPKTKIVQKYGTSEFGAIRSRSKSNDSLFIEVKEDETQIQVRDGLLWVKSQGTMLGYLNADSTIDEGGWIFTGDMVEQQGPWLRILGRASDLINVGGEKVIPAEVEAIIQQLDFVIDTTVRSEQHPLTGMVVVADVVVIDLLDIKDAKSRREITKQIRRHCLAHLPSYKVPVNIHFVTGATTTDRQKKSRRQKTSGS